MGIPTRTDRSRWQSGDRVPDGSVPAASASPFDPISYYQDYPRRVLLRPGYPARAQFKGSFMWGLYGDRLLGELGEIGSMADIGGCFGFGANSMAFQVARATGKRPEMYVFEISPEFVRLGRQLFPDIQFVEANILTWDSEPRTFDVVTLFDVIEHIPNPLPFLRGVARRARYGLFKTPLETKGEWQRPCAPALTGATHPDGHVNFFTVPELRLLIEDAGFDVLASRVVRSMIPIGADLALMPEAGPPLRTLRSRLNIARRCHNSAWLNLLIRKLRGGGELVCLVRSRYH